MSEELTNYLSQAGIKVAYLHNEIKTLERLEIVHDLRTGKYDCVVGVNLLREGIDIPEVSLIAILDADKQGFLRSTRSLIQTIGRAARNAGGKVIMYADTISESMDEAIKETYRRREIQDNYNKEHGITPTTIKKPIAEVIKNKDTNRDLSKVKYTKKEKDRIMKEIENEMMKAARELDFERATELRDILFEMRSE
jgi:excinuclease ABC subunit B